MNIQAILTSARTTVIGAVAALCGGAHLAGLIPDNWVTVLDGVCTVLLGLGLVAAKDAHVTSEQAGLTQTTQANQVIKVVPILLLLTSLSACSMLSSKTQAVMVQAAIDAQKVVVTGCAGLPVVEVLASQLEAQVPSIQKNIQLAEDIAAKVCAAAAQLQAK